MCIRCEVANQTIDELKRELERVKKNLARSDATVAKLLRL